MTTEPTRDPQQPDNAVAYNLALSQKRDGLSTLTSPLLDEDMHHGRAVDVAFERGAPGPEVLDPFQLDSLVHYLTDQANIRRALEAALDRDHECHYPEVPRGAAVWNVVKVEVVAFQERKILTREEAFSVKEIFPNITDEDIERELADSDTPDTRWKFMVMLAGSWTDGHQRIVYFRDGALRSLTFEG